MAGIGPFIHHPATALGVLNGREKRCFFSGANVGMKKVAPDNYKALYKMDPSPWGRTVMGTTDPRLGAHPPVNEADFQKGSMYHGNLSSGIPGSYGIH